MDSGESFSASYQRCCIDEEFLSFFLQHFCLTNPRFSDRFEDVDTRRQTTMLKASIILIQNASENTFIRNNVQNLARRHKDMGLNIQPEELIAWRESLLATVEAFDPLYDDDVGDAWRSTLQIGIDIMEEYCTD
ncbi:globin [Vibrio renipiscarius]|uniref:Globin n=1 Tax=Vibrio renipiscarius TaxID=1461322 RepID=A0A0C2NPQ3_9VIBR|nr:globin [Vibrio renipiscarius]KII76082.1 hypothetical protein OJ16_14765 [Vibrio renipiscarius]KII79187.1 hypothetical protein PL18_10225 [Vibrio renipiscarius]